MIFNHILSFQVFATQFGYLAIVRGRRRMQLSHRWDKNLRPFSGSAGPSDWPGTGLRLVSVASFFLPLASPSQIDLQPIVHLGYPVRNWFSFPHIRGPLVTRGETRVGHGHWPSFWTWFSPLVSLRFYPAFDSSACVDLRNRSRRWRSLHRERWIEDKNIRTLEDCRITQCYIKREYNVFIN